MNTRCGTLRTGTTVPLDLAAKAMRLMAAVTNDRRVRMLAEDLTLLEGHDGWRAEANTAGRLEPWHPRMRRAE